MNAPPTLNLLLYIFFSELVQSNLDKAKFTVKQLKQELRLKDLLNSQIKVTKDLISNHALGHVATLNRLQVDYISAKRK